MHLLPSLPFAVTEATPISFVDASMYPLLISLIPLLPILGFAFTALFGRRLMARWGRGAAEIVPVGTVIVVWVIALLVIVPALTHAEPFGEHGFETKLWTWIPAGSFQVDLGFHVDALTAVLLLVVTTIGMLVHVYSIGYMAHDPGTWRFFAYLNLFMFSMLVLVLASSWVLVFGGWELVGLSSYSLIGFWYHKRSAALAAKKAFIVNRVGDVGFALGIMAIFVNTGTMNIQDSIAKLIETPAAALTIPLPVVALLVFAGAMGKSAQFPLHVWLPDAMEGPTPVSALIHAATMVNAGVYLVARANPLFAHAQEAMVVVAAIGIFTAIFAASIAFTQTDIKRVLAYSTLSQLGYMFAALGVGAYAAAIFHLMTHGFFKGLLFLGSGSVIHAVHEEQDMNRMGALWRKIPITHWTMLVGTIAIAGIPPLAGFFSKDEILGEAFKFAWFDGLAIGYVVWGVGLVVAMMTAFYMWRLMGKTFYGESRVDPHVEPRIHESPWQMTLPLVLLAIPSIALGMVLGLPLGDSMLSRWLEPVFKESEAFLYGEGRAYQLFGIDGYLILASVAVATIGLVAGWMLFGFFRTRGRRSTVEAITNANGATRFLYRASLNKWWFDDLNDLLFIRIGGRVAAFLWWFDRTIVDGAVNGVGFVTRDAGGGLRRIQTGRVQNYALGIAIGLLVMAGSFLLIVGQPR
ncbi:MAG TPA: NADH-quinone oxidoreductase subunit L [Candidatus Limnocylindrales bacterium]|jgi:NADH-quinone oxidoreductase subunit L